MHRCLQKYPQMGNLLFLDVRKVESGLIPLLPATERDRETEYWWELYNKIGKTYPTAKDEDLVFTKDNLPCEEAEADNFYFCTGLISTAGTPIFLHAILNNNPKTRWYGCGFQLTKEAAPPRVEAPEISFESATELSQLVFIPRGKMSEHVPMLLGDEMFSETQFYNGLLEQFRKKKNEACSFSKNELPSTPEEADRMIFTTGMRTPEGVDIVMECARNNKTGREPWFGNFFSAGRQSSAKLVEFKSKVFIHSSKLDPFLRKLCHDYSISPMSMYATIAKRYLALAPDEIMYFNGNCRSSDEDSADHMVFPTGFYHFKTHEEIMLRCSLNTREKCKWVARQFYLPSENSFYGRRPQKWIFTWAKFTNSVNPTEIDPIIRDLKNMALPESWSFGGTDDLFILRNYFIYTFTRLWREKKVLENQEAAFAAFNTGLVNSAYEYIYAMFRPSTGNDVRRWWFVGFTIAGTAGNGKELVRTFFPLPQPARYFTPDVPIYYKFNDEISLLAQIPNYNAEHILLERTYRLPASFLGKYLYEIDGLAECYYKAKQITQDKLEYKAAWRAVGDCLRDTVTYRRMKDDLDNVVETAVKRTSWNYRTVIPYYSPADNKLSLLLPLSMGGGDCPDLAMVLEATPNGQYIGHTVITLAMAYNNSRLVCRPESDWLNMSIIQDEAEPVGELDAEAESGLSAEDEG